MQNIFIIIEMDQTLNLKAHLETLQVGHQLKSTGHIIEKIGPILATKYIEIN